MVRLQDMYKYGTGGRGTGEDKKTSLNKKNNQQKHQKGQNSVTQALNELEM